MTPSHAPPPPSTHPPEGLDGIITTFAVVAGATGGGLDVHTILILGFSNIFADALSMGVGDALSTKAENEFILGEKMREEWEMKNNPEGEIDEMVDLYVEKGMSKEDAQVGGCERCVHTRVAT